MDTAFVIGNGESRNIFPIDTLKGKGVIWGCNAIYRDYPDLCDHIVSVNENMTAELQQWKQGSQSTVKVYGLEDTLDWNWIIEGDKTTDVPDKLKLYRIWRGGTTKNGGKIRTLDFSEAKGSGTSAVAMAADSGIKNVIILAFDILGARQWEYAAVDGSSSREQNNIYKNTKNYPSRLSMKAYLKYEWMYHLRQTFRRYPNTNFYFINRREYIEYNYFLPGYFDQPNINVGTYADLQRWVNGEKDKIQWWPLN